MDIPALFEAAGIVDEPLGEVVIPLADDFPAFVAELRVGSCGKLPVSISGQFQAPDPATVIGGNCEALAIEVRGPLLAGIAGDEMAAFQTLRRMPTCLIGGTDIGPLGRREAFGHGSGIRRCSGIGEARQSGEEG